jgi:hypothetical protein
LKLNEALTGAQSTLQRCSAKLAGSGSIWGDAVKAVTFAVLAAGVAGIASEALAHHSFATQYDENAPVTLTGVVTKVEWLNPHARFYIDVETADGEVVNWNLELASPNVLRRNGWLRNSLEEGDVVTVEGSRARNGTLLANARTVQLADGTQVFARPDVLD